MRKTPRVAFSRGNRWWGSPPPVQRGPRSQRGVNEELGRVFRLLQRQNQRGKKLCGNIDFPMATALPVLLFSFPKSGTTGKGKCRHPFPGLPRRLFAPSPCSAPLPPRPTAALAPSQTPSARGSAVGVRRFFLQLNQLNTKRFGNGFKSPGGRWGHEVLGKKKPVLCFLLSNRGCSHLSPAHLRRSREPPCVAWPPRPSPGCLARCWASARTWR